MDVKYLKTLSKLALCIVSMSCFANEEENNGFKVSGNISAVSAYINRGSTSDPENDNATIQTTLKFDYKNFYFVYFNSKLGYSFSEIQNNENLYLLAESNINSNIDPNISEEEYVKALESEYNRLSLNSKKASAFSHYENDFILGYENNYKKLNYDLNLKYLYYAEADHTGGVEAGLSLKYPIREDKDSMGVSFETYLNDVYYMNKGDTYMELNYENILAPSYYLNVYAGFSYFKEDGKYVKDSTEDFVFRHATLEIAHSLDEKEQVFGWMQYIIGGKDRFSESQKNMVVAGLSYNF